MTLNNFIRILAFTGVLSFGTPVFLDPSYYGKLGFLVLLFSILSLSNTDGKSLLFSSIVLGFGYLITGEFLNHTFLTIAVLINLYKQPKQNTFNWIFTATAIANVFNIVIWILLSTLTEFPSEYWLYPSGHPNLFSSYLFLTSIILLYAIYTENITKLAYTLVTVNLLVIFIEGSYGSIIALTISCITFIFPWSKLTFFSLGKKVRLIGATLLFFILYSILLPSVLSSPSFQLNENESNTTIVERTTLWRNSYNTMNRAAIFGKGASQWPIEYLSQGYPKIYRARELNVLFQRPHNEFIRIYFEFGILGLIALSFGLSYILTTTYTLAKSRKSLNIVFSGLIGFIVPMTFSFPLERVEHTFLLMVLCLITLEHQNETF